MFIESIISTNRYTDIFIEVVESILFTNLVFNVIIKSIIEYNEESVLSLLQFRKDSFKLNSIAAY